MSVPSAAVFRSGSGDRRYIHHKSYAIIGIFFVSLALFVYWGFFRLFVCWGNEDNSLATLFGCHIVHWIILGFVMLGLGLEISVFTELASLRSYAYPTRNVRRSRAAYEAYRFALTRHEKWSSGMGGALLALSLMMMIVIVCLSPIRF